MPSLELSFGFEEKVLELAAKSPVAAIMLLSLEIDHQLKLILATIGQLQSYAPQSSPSLALDLIDKRLLASASLPIPHEVRDTVERFWTLRNLAAHSEPLSQGLAMRAVDYGIPIIRMLQSIPRPSFVVVGLVTLFLDKECTVPEQEVRGVILDCFGSGGENHGRRVPPTRKDYLRGQNVSWEWDWSGRGWRDQTWYRDPESGEIKSEWSESLEFIGRPLEEI